MEATTEKQSDAILFKTSASQIQDVDFSPQTRVRHNNIPENTPQKEGWFAHRFGKEHGFGSAVIAADTISTSLMVLAGHKEKDRIRELAMSLATAINLWAFASSRGAKMPEGDTVSKRIVNTIKHPSESSVHFAMLGSIVAASLMTAGNLYKGIQGGVERTRIITAAFDFIGVLMMTSGLFKKQKAQDTTSQQSDPVAFKTSDSRSLGFTGHLKEVYQYAWKTDKRGILGRYISMATQLSNLTEGLVKRGHPDKAATNLLTAAGINMGLLLGNSFYTYDRLMRETDSKSLPGSPQPGR